MPEKFIFMLKTYRDDLAFADRLISSYHKHNQGDIPLYIVVPQLDMPVFQKFESIKVTLIPEESIPCRLAPPSSDPRESGYINQQVLKLAFYRLRIADNYMCLDSDGIFIRDFTMNDFFHEDGLPFHVLAQDKLLQADRDYVDTHWRKRARVLEGISSFLQIEYPKNLKTCHGFQTFQSKVLERFDKEILSKATAQDLGFEKGGEIDFLDLISLFGVEFTWYNYYLQKTEPVIHEVEPLFLYIHTGRQLVEFQLFRTTTQDLANGFVGVVVNGNFQHFSWGATLQKNRVLNAAAYVKSFDLLRMCCRFGAALFLRALSSPLVRIRRLMRRKT